MNDNVKIKTIIDVLKQIDGTQEDIVAATVAALVRNFKSAHMHITYLGANAEIFMVEVYTDHEWRPILTVELPIKCLDFFEGVRNE